MYTSIRRYSVEPSQMDELMHRVDSEFARHIAVRPGFATYEAIDLGDGFLTISAFLEAEEAEESRSLARDWVRVSLADIPIEVEEVVHGEIVVNRAVRDAMHPVHSEGYDARAEIRRMPAGRDPMALIARIDDELADEIAAMPGFRSFRAADCESEIQMIALFETAEDARPAAELMDGFIPDGIESMSGPVRVSRTRARMLKEAHA